MKKHEVLKRRMKDDMPMKAHMKNEKLIRMAYIQYMCGSKILITTGFQGPSTAAGR